MKLGHTLVIAGTILIAFLLHAAITAPLAVEPAPALPPVQDKGLTLALKRMDIIGTSSEMHPRSIDLGARKILYIPEYECEGQSFTVKYVFFEYVEGKLHRVHAVSKE